MGDVSELDYLHDVVYNATGKSLNNVEIEELATKLPLSILNIGLEWGFGDTVFRDKVFDWLKKEISR